MAEVAYGRYEEAYRAIHSALCGITAPPLGKKISKFSFTWNTNGTIAPLNAYDGAALLYTLTFTWNGMAHYKKSSGAKTDDRNSHL